MPCSSPRARAQTDHSGSALPVLTSQKPHRRVHTSPRIMKAPCRAASTARCSGAPLPCTPRGVSRPRSAFARPGTDGRLGGNLEPRRLAASEGPHLLPLAPGAYVAQLRCEGRQLQACQCIVERSDKGIGRPIEATAVPIRSRKRPHQRLSRMHELEGPLEQRATVHHERLAGHPARGVARQEGDRLCDVIRLAQPAEWGGRDHRVRDVT